MTSKIKGEKNNMKILNSKSKIITIAIILTLTVSVLITGISFVSAQTKKNTVALLNVNPETVQLGKDILITVVVVPMPPLRPDSSQGEARSGYYYELTKPNGTTETIGPRDSDPAGSGTDWLVYTPDQIGTWKIKFNWAGDELFEGTESPELQFEVQSEPTPSWPSAPLPDYYWSRPISAANREWYVLGGAWMEATGRDTPCFNPYSTAPESSHILWKVQTGGGGLIGGMMGSTAYQSTAPSKVIIMGRAYFVANDGTHCIDVHTGEELWETPVSTQRTLFALPGSTPYLWGIGSSVFERYDILTGEVTKTVTGQPTGDALFEQFGSRGWRRNRMWMSPDGILYINVDDRFELFGGLVAYDTNVRSSDYYAGVLWCIERTHMNGTEVALYNYPYGNSTAVTVKTYDMPIQDLANMAIDTEAGIIFCSSNGGNSAAGFSMTTGELLWNDVQVADTLIIEGQNAVIDGVGFCASEDTMKVYGYDLASGNLIWESEPGIYPWGAFRAYSSGAAYGKAYFLCYDGTVRAYNTDGSIEWTFHGRDDLWGETPYGTWPFYQNPAIADGKVYACTYEHSPTLPLKRGERLYAIDDETGEELWSIMGCNSHLAIADGVLVASDTYMPLIYGFDKGQTETKVMASPTISARGSSVLITGSVMDLSPAQPNTPAVSDEDMSAWMEYLHMQQACPADATGVEVVITTFDPNGNTYELGRATTDMSGTFGCVVDPPVPGLYKIIATFEGSESYYGSFAQTYINVEEASSVTQPIEPEPETPTHTEFAPTEPEPTTLEPTTPESTEPTAETSLITMEIAIIAAVAVACIIGIAAFWTLRKRK
jgi:outer membrane protein assembly factor BamB